MENLFPLGMLNNLCLRSKYRKILQIVRVDGKVIKFTSPLLVEDLLTKYDHGLFGVGSSKKALKNLPLSFKLKLGKVYYLLPCKALDDQAKNRVVVEVDAKLKSGGASRIKIVITKQQLKDLLSKNISIENIILVSHKSGTTNWIPSLTSIPEGNELNTYIM